MNGPHDRLDFFEPGDLTSLVCIDAPDTQRIVIDQLGELNYKIHTGLFIEDILLKMRAHIYDVVVISEKINGTDLESNPILTEFVDLPLKRRRKQYVVLAGSSFQTNSELEAFRHSVDLVINLSDVMNLKPVLRRGVHRKRELYAPIETAGAEKGQ